ncbi:DNA ligase [Yersinia phage phi80-18]|uniref:DNA ligase n=1 Tax=Yersinia phage phi80-18 TaxID=1206559 RepID=I7K3E6_9CAUD|nr:DNA ligase [Yersinia phage phi80-18]CCI88861.2 DNA ligase [Yersinia phage phi80-18]
MAKLACMKGVAFEEKRLRQWLSKDGLVVVQTKRDEFRCIVRVMEDCEGQYVTFTSASGKPLYNLQAHSSVFLDLYARFNINKFDMGCSIDDDFNVTRRVLRASKKVYDTTGLHSQTITETKTVHDKHGIKYKETVYKHTGTLNAVFWFYDMPEVLDAYEDRRIVMAHLTLGSQGRLACPETWIVSSVNGIDAAVTEVTDLFADALDAQHEGLMVKRYNFVYKEGRTTDWMKLKPEDEVDARITGFTEGKGEFLGLIGSAIGKTEAGDELAFSGFTLEERRAITAHPEKFIGRVAEVRFMQRDSKGGFRHPSFYRWHPDK